VVGQDQVRSLATHHPKTTDTGDSRHESTRLRRRPLIDLGALADVREHQHEQPSDRKVTYECLGSTAGTRANELTGNKPSDAVGRSASIGDT
jgi:hypothetical protein